jgi:transketolase
MMKLPLQAQERAINTIRFLAADAVQRANSGHPGLPMGAAAMVFALWTRHLHFSPKNPTWIARDRFILSGGHGSMLLYALLYLTGYDLALEDLQKFRQWGSLTPGHPEYGLTPGVEVTTGPLGQGFANGVGMAMAARRLAQEFNRPGYSMIDPKIYALVTDGDLMEGVSSEAASLAGHLQLGNLIYLYDDNHISIDGSTDLAFTEDRAARFTAYGWQVLHVPDGNDVEAIDAALQLAKSDPRPSLIVCRSIIGFGLPTRQGTAKAHGEPPGDEELSRAKESLSWPQSPAFFVPEDSLEFFRQVGQLGDQLANQWNELMARFTQNFPDLASEFNRRFSGMLAPDWDRDLPVFPADEKGLATRTASGKTINALAATLPELWGGSADLAPSNNTWIQGSPAFQKDIPEGRNLHFGVREHAMASAVNGMAVFGGVLPYAATFLVFSDYMRPSIRLAALSNYPSIWVFTHDGIGVGEDGPTHQPVEHFAALRSIPGLVMLRPGDANEAVEAWKIAVRRARNQVAHSDAGKSTALIFTRQNIPVLDRTLFAPASNVQYGAYVLADLGGRPPELILMASGYEVSLIVKAGRLLADQGIGVRLVSFPSWELFASQPLHYRDSVLPEHLTARVAVEAGVTLGWERWVGDHGEIIGLNRFGASAPYSVLYEKFGITVEAIIAASLRLLRR